MQVQEIMTRDPACCTPQTDLQQVAKLMMQHDCGAIPVVEDDAAKRPIGIITDRDIVCRAVAEGQNPFAGLAGDCMTSPVVTVAPDMDMEACCNLMEEKRIRRVVVLDGDGCCCGIVAQADIALSAPKEETGEVVKQISEPGEASREHMAGMRH